MGKTWNVGVKVVLKRYEDVAIASMEEKVVEGGWPAGIRELRVLLQIQINMGDRRVVAGLQLNSTHLAPGLPALSLGKDIYTSFSLGSIVLPLEITDLQTY